MRFTQPSLPSDDICMRGSLGSRLLPGAPRWWLALVVTAALGGLLTGTGRTGSAGQSAPGATGFLLIVVPHVGLLTVLIWRARSVAHERDVWSRIALGFAAMAGILVTTSVLGLLPVTREIATAAGLWAPVLAFPLVYGGVVRWNRFRTTLADPNDWLNGLSAVLAVVAVTTLVVDVTPGPLSAAPWWVVQPLLARFAVEFVIVGTVATLPFLGDMGRDPRTWLVIGAFGASLTASTATLLSGGQPGTWAWAAGPVAVVSLALAAVLRPGRAEPQPADPTASTVGAFVVIVASTAVLVATTLLDTDGPATWCAALAATGCSVRLLTNVRELSVLAATRREAMTDELTGLANRRAVLRRVDELGRTGVPLALALLDLDKFKEVNDALGHAAGDHLLRMVAARLEAVLRPGDVLGRLGGDEFAVVALIDPDAPLGDTALGLGRRLHDRMAEPFLIEGLIVHTAVSVGVTTRSGGTDDGAEAPAQLLREADVAMYDAKRSGAGVAVYDSSRHADSSGHLALVEELRTAMAGGQLVLHHQPKLDIGTGATVGVEALVRWQHPVRGLLGPGEFLPLAEVHGLMGALTEEVLTQAVAQAAAWRASGLDLRMSVNLSASNLLDAGLPARVAGLLERHGLPPESLVLEVTESVLLTDPDRSLAVVGALADLGVTVSIDDFGTGYSSLAYLRELPVAELKLDRSFTADLLTSDRTGAIVASTIELAHRLGLRVVAEGVEDEATLEHLRSLGCDTSQGYLHSRPLPADAFARWLTAQGSPLPVG